MADTNDQKLGITKEQLLNALTIVKRYIDNSSIENVLPANLKTLNEATGTLQPLQYLGTNKNNKLGLFYFPQTTATKTGLNQVTTLSVKNGQIVNIDIEGSPEKFLIQVYKFVAGESNIVEIMKEFNNSDKNNFVYSKDVSFKDNNCSICSLYENPININLSSQLYESDEIKTNEFLDLESIEEVD